MTGADWRPDPTGWHVYRYYDGTAWTQHVADADGATIDPLDIPSVAQPLPKPSATDGENASSGQMPTGARLHDSIGTLARWSDKRLNRAARWLNNRTTTAKDPDDLRVLESKPGDAAILGQWSGLVASIGNYGVATSAIVGGDAMLGVLRAVSGSVDAQERLLRSIDSKLDALVKGPFNTGVTHLSEAERVATDPEARLEHIKEAKDCFYLAHGQAASLQSRAVVEYHLGVVWLLLDRPADAVHWMAQSHASCIVVASELARETKHIRVLRSPTSTAAAVAFYPAGVVVLGMKFKNMVVAERAREALREFLPFLACVTRSHNLLAGEAAEQLAGLALVSVGDDSYELVSTADLG
jgi:hypothetical protein